MANTNVSSTTPFQFKCFKDLEKLFGPPPILKGENPEAYVSLGQALWDARPPEDFFQATRINDATYLLWEGNRQRMMKVKLIEASTIEGAKIVIRRISGESYNSGFWSEWAQGKTETVDYVSSLLNQAGLDQSAIIAQTIEVIVDTLEVIERQSAQFEARRHVTIRELDLYSENFERRRLLAQEQRREIADHRTATRQSKRKVLASSTEQLPLNYVGEE